MPPLWPMREREGCKVTWDRGPQGWGCPKAIAPPSRAPGADYVLTDKANPKHRPDRLEDTCAQEQAQGCADGPHDYPETVGKDHGRLETRCCGVMGAPAYGQYVEPEAVWADWPSRVRVESERRCGGQVTPPGRYFLARLPPEARTLWAAVRNHGRMENAMPWVLDVALRADDRGIRRDQAPHHRALWRRLTLNVLTQEKTATLGGAHKRLKVAWDLSYQVKLGEVLLQGNKNAIALT